MLRGTAKKKTHAKMIEKLTLNMILLYWGNSKGEGHGEVIRYKCFVRHYYLLTRPKIIDNQLIIIMIYILNKKMDKLHYRGTNQRPTLMRGRAFRVHLDTEMIFPFR